MKTYPKLYKHDNKGKTRVWWCEQDGESIRNVSGILDGSYVESGWKLMFATNVGRANELTAEQQGEAEIAALYEKQLGKGGYHRDIANAAEKKYIEPMLAKSYKDMSDVELSAVVFSQPKLDGFRCIATKDSLMSRSGKQYFSVPHIEEELKQLFAKYPTAILDGELYNHGLRDNFNQLSSYLRKQKPNQEELEAASVMEYHIYDIIDTNASTKGRQLTIDLIFAEFEFDAIVRVRTDEVDQNVSVDQLYGEYLAEGYEGQMLRTNAKYEIDKRSKSLIKRKEFFDEEFEVVDILEGEGNWAGCAKTVVYQLNDRVITNPDDLPRAGIKGDKAFTQKLLLNKHLYIPGQVTVKFPNKTPDGYPRFPVAIAWHPGKREL